MLRHKNLCRIMLSSGLRVLTRVRPFLSRCITFSTAINGTIGDCFPPTSAVMETEDNCDVFTIRKVKIQARWSGQTQVSETARFLSIFGMKADVRPFRAVQLNCLDMNRWIAASHFLMKLHSVFAGYLFMVAQLHWMSAFEICWMTSCWDLNWIGMLRPLLSGKPFLSWHHRKVFKLFPYPSCFLKSLENAAVLEKFHLNFSTVSCKFQLISNNF